MVSDCTVTVLRGQRVENEYLDVEDVPVIVHHGLPAELHESLPETQLEGTGTKADVRCVGRIRGLTVRDIRVGDRVTNDQTGATYVVDQLKRISLAGGGVRLKMTKVSGKL